MWYSPPLWIWWKSKTPRERFIEEEMENFSNFVPPEEIKIFFAFFPNPKDASSYIKPFSDQWKENFKAKQLFHILNLILIF